MISRILSLLAALGLIGSTTAKMAPSGDAKMLHSTAQHHSQFAPGVLAVLFDGGGGSSGGSTDGLPPKVPVPTPW